MSRNSKHKLTSTSRGNDIRFTLFDTITLKSIFSFSRFSSMGYLDLPITDRSTILDQNIIVFGGLRVLSLYVEIGRREH